MEGEEIAAVLRGLPEGAHGVVAAPFGIGGNVVRQLDVVAVALPRVVDDADMIDAVVFQRPEHVAVVGETAACDAPEIQNRERAKRGAVGGRREGDVREDFARRVREGDITCFRENIASAIRLFIVSGVAVGI